MQLSIDRDVLAAALGKLQGIVEKRTTQAVLSSVLLQTDGTSSLQVAATDRDLCLLGNYPATIEDAGAVCLGARSLYEIVRALPPGVVELKTADNHYVNISIGSSHFRIVGSPAEQFPPLPVADSVKGFALPLRALLEMVDGILFSVSTDDTRPNLNGALLRPAGEGKLMMASTDGHRLSKICRPIDADVSALPEEGVIIPRKGLAELRRAMGEGDGTIFLGIQGNSMVFRTEHEVLFVRLIDGKFPDFDRVIQKDSAITALVERLPLLDALRRVSIVSTERTRGVRATLHGERMVLKTTNPDVGEATEDLPVAYEQEVDLGAGLEVGYNARYLMDALSALSEDEVRYETNDQTSPTILRNRGDDESYYVVMPMRF